MVDNIKLHELELLLSSVDKFKRGKAWVILDEFLSYMEEEGVLSIDIVSVDENKPYESDN